MDRADLSSLTLFAAVAARRSFRAAARELNLSPSAISHAVGNLEERLGMRLLARTTRSVAPTEAGQRLLERLEPALAEISAAIESAGETRKSPSGVLRLTVPRSAAHLVLLRRSGEFARAYPDITLEIDAEDRFADIVAGGFDAGVRLGESLEKDMIALRMGPNQRMIVVAAPSWLDKSFIPQHPRDLGQCVCINQRFPNGTLYRWEFEKDGEAIEVAVEGPLVLNDDRLILEAVLNGAGLGFVFQGLAAPALARGELVRVLDDWCPIFPGFFLYYPSNRQLRPAMRAFIDFFTGRGDARPSSRATVP